MLASFYPYLQLFRIRFNEIITIKNSNRDRQTMKYAFTKDFYSAVNSDFFMEIAMTVINA